MTYPDDCLQRCIAPNQWWNYDKDCTEIRRGALVWAFVPHVNLTPLQFIPQGRANAEDHKAAIVEVSPLRVNAPLSRLELPVAAMTTHDDEVFAAYKAKRRPCIVYCDNCTPVDRELTKGKPSHSTAPTICLTGKGVKGICDDDGTATADAFGSPAHPSHAHLGGNQEFVHNGFF